jgi:hypothetical protein
MLLPAAVLYCVAYSQGHASWSLGVCSCAAALLRKFEQLPPALLRDAATVKK